MKYSLIRYLTLNGNHEPIKQYVTTAVTFNSTMYRTSLYYRQPINLIIVDKQFNLKKKSFILNHKYNGAKYGEIDLNIYIKNIVTSCQNAHINKIIKIEIVPKSENRLHTHWILWAYHSIKSKYLLCHALYMLLYFNLLLFCIHK